MIGITTYDSTRTEPLLYIQNFEMTEELNGNFEIAFNSLNIPENVGHELIQEEAVVYVNNIGFRIKQLETTTTMKRVIAISLYFDNVVTRRKSIYGGTRTLKDFLGFLYDGTGWTYSVEGLTESRLIPNFGDDNIQSLTEVLLNEFQCERKIMADRHLHFAKEIGPDNEAQYRYGYNIKAMTEKVDTTSMYSRIEGRGADGLSVMYISPNEPMIGIREAEPFEDEEYKDAALLLKRTSREIMDYPAVSFELDAVELTDKELGERVWLIYEPLGISFQTRILSKVSTLRNLDVVTSSVVLGNAKPRTLSNILAEQNVAISATNKQVRSKFEQTSDKIELVVERIGEAESSFVVTADEIRAEVSAKNIEQDGAIAENSSLISQTATAIRLEVSGEITRVDGRVDSAFSSITQTANEIRAEIAEEVSEIDGTLTEQSSSISQLSGAISSKAETSVTNALGTRVTTAEQTISSHTGTISQKVSTSDYNGNTIASMINQSATTITIQASKINLVGAVSVLSDISGNLGSITSGNIDIYNEIKVGGGIHMRSSSLRVIRMGVDPINYGSISVNEGHMTLDAGNTISLTAPVNFNGMTPSNLIVTARWG